VELAVHIVERARHRPLRGPRPVWFAADHAVEAEAGHQALKRDRDAFAIKLPPDLARAIDLRSNDALTNYFAAAFLPRTKPARPR
jgi:hypothetical protein